MGDENSNATPAPSPRPLKERLTNGESPRLEQRQAFALPILDDAEPGILKRGTQVLLLAATQTERDAVLERLQPIAGQQRVLRVFSGAQTYYVGRLGSVDVVLTTCKAGSQGRDGSGLVTYEAIGRARPRAVVAVGMAFGGYTEKLKIGDVLVSSHAIPYEPSRKQAEGDVHRGGEPEAGPLLLNRILEARGWTFRRSDGEACKVRDGRILSGEKLVDDLGFKTELFADHPEAIGGEMEGSGVYGASARRGITEWIIVKAVCDWGDGTKHKEHQPLAATVAVALVEHVFTPKGVLDDLPAHSFTDDAQQSPGGTSPSVVNNGANIGNQNIVFGNQTVIVSSSGDIDELLDAIELLLNNGLIAEAEARLAYANNRVSARMDNAQKARLRALRGKRKLLDGNHAEAARDFLEAHDMNPNDEKAVARKCLGLMLEGRAAEAYQEALAVLSRFPNHPYARHYLIRSASEDVPIDDLLPRDWRRLQLPSSEAVPAAHRLLNSDLGLAEEILARVREPKKEDAEYWTALASVIGQRILEAERGGETIAESRRDELVSALKRAFAAVTSPKSEEQRGNIAFGIAVNSRRLGRTDDHARWIAIAKELISNSIEVLTERAQDAGDRGDFTTAVELLRGIVSSPNRPDLARVVFANALLQLGKPDAAQEACAVLDQVASDTAEPIRDRQIAANRLIDAQLGIDRTAAADAIERHQAALGSYRAERWRLVLAHEQGKLEHIVAIANRMMESRHGYTHDELLDFGSVLERLRLDVQSVQVLDTIAPRNELGKATTSLLNAATRCGRLELVASVCKALRANGVEDSQILDGEACVLQIRGDLSGALELVQQWLAKHPDDKRVRLRLSLVACELGLTELLPTHSDELPTPDEGRPEIALQIVQILRAANQHTEARRFAYANFKRRRRDEWAWKAMSIAGFPPTQPTSPPEADGQLAEPPPLLAGPGMAVRIKERNSSRWINLEESDALATAEDEYGPNHPTTLALTGKKVGDKVALQAASFGIRPRLVEIEGITSCFVRACQQCNDSYELQFPDSPFIHSFETPDSPDELIELLTASMRNRHESVENIVKQYEDKPRVPLYTLAELTGRSVFEVIPFLVAGNHVIHASRPPQRMQAGRDALEQTREIVIETTAVCTLAMLESIERVRTLFSRLWIARATLDRLRAYIQRTISDGSAGHMGLEGGQLFMTRWDPAFESRRAEYLRRLLAAVEAWDVFSESERNLIPSERWDQWTRVAGGGTAESIHLAKRLGLPLWTDDFPIAASAEHEGVAPISTQAVFETLATIETAPRDEMAEVGAKLVGWRYVDTRTPPESFLAAAKIAKWDPAARPLLQHMELLTVADWAEPNLALVMAEVFRLWWNNTLDRKAVDALIVAALIRLAGRANGERVLKLLFVAVHRRFGLDVIGARHVSETIVGWMATR
jgi:nucleoside phosphorylase/tetratricopeptide (TPR) repeat protein